MACMSHLPASLVSTLLAATLASCANALAATTDNLVVNGDAEAHRCTPDWSAQTPVPGWTVLHGAASVLCYEAFARAHEKPELPSANRAGHALFAAPGADTSIGQQVDVRVAAAAIDAGGLGWELSAWLGGWRGSVPASLTAIFLGEDGHATGAPVVLGGGAARARTGLSARAARGLVPAGTRSVLLELMLPGGALSFGDSYGDNIRLQFMGDVGALAAPALAPPAPAGVALDHVFVVMMENTNHADVTGPDGRPLASRMPYLAALAREGVTLSQMWANYHPSDQNYVAMVAGDTFAYGPVYYPDYDLAAPHLGDLLEARGRSWRAYVQAMRVPCNLAKDAQGAGHYAPDDQPFAHFRSVVADRARCGRTLRDLADLQADIDAQALPSFAWVSADGWWDGEGAWEERRDVAFSLARQDEFLRGTLEPLLASRAWRESRSLLVITWDESLGWGWPDNRVPTILAGSPGLLRAGAVIDEHFDGYSVLRTIEDALGLPGLGKFDLYAQPLASAFAGRDARSVPQAFALEALPASFLRGGIHESFGRVVAPAAVRRGESLEFRIAPGASVEGLSVVFEPLGRAPDRGSPSFAFDRATRTSSVSSPGLAPGTYGAWLRGADGRFDRAPIPVRILPPSQLDAVHPGVEILGAETGPTGAVTAAVRQGGNIIVRYCRPAGVAAGEAWIALLPRGARSASRAEVAAGESGRWIDAPGGGNETGGLPCGEAMLYSAALEPGADYEVRMLRDDGAGTGWPVGRGAGLRVIRAAP
jgi:hypothetical protein